MPRTILITGCSTGIGRALAAEFARQGCAVIATARRPESIADLAGPATRTEALDVTDEAAIVALAGRLAAEGVAVDMVVNNAGFGTFGPLADTSSDDLRAQFETNVVGLMAVTRAFLPPMIARRAGTIVNIASIVGLFVTPFGAPYSASKYAVNALTDGLRLELAPFGIRVVCVQPGGVKSAFGATAEAGARARLNTGSAYAPFRAAIERRAARSQKTAMPADVFARETVARLLRAAPPDFIRLGSYATLGPLLARWLPHRLTDRLLRKAFGLG